MGKRVAIAARDLFFRAKLQAIVRSAGGVVTAPDEECDLAVVELGKPEADTRIRALAEHGIPVLAFGSHVDPDALRAARDQGARAVPNSQVEQTLRELLAAG
jgi:hypothetical protein